MFKDTSPIEMTFPPINRFSFNEMFLPTVRFEFNATSFATDNFLLKLASDPTDKPAFMLTSLIIFDVPVTSNLLLRFASS